VFSGRNLLSVEMHNIFFSRRAIALSLQSAPRSSENPQAMCVDSDEDEARFQADLARAIAASKVNPSPTTSIASLSSDQSQVVDPAFPPSSSTAAHSISSFLGERAQLEQERLARVKRLRGEQSTGSPSKRRAQSREMGCAPGSQAGPSRKGEEAPDEEAEVFWDGELRQTANKHVKPGHNGENGRPVFRLSQIIGDVSPFFSLCFASSLNGSDSESTDRAGNHLDIRPRALLDLYIFRP
jgi:tyrosyl-DNA phosphodiesterase 1